VKQMPFCKNRVIMAVAGDISGNPQLICRYITPQKPPDGCDTPKKFTRFVSMIPFMEDIQISSGNKQEVWCTSPEFLRLGSGDWEEHAVLLANYLKHFWDPQNLAAGHRTGGMDDEVKHHTFVILGHGIPEGETAYVLVLTTVCVDSSFTHIALCVTPCHWYFMNNSVKHVSRIVPSSMP
jgi:coiled-coil and C2 domain-containing protein 2A